MSHRKTDLGISSRKKSAKVVLGPGYLREFGGSCFLSEAAFCCAAFVLPDDTCADAMLQSMAAAKRANSIILILIAHSFPDGPI